MVEENETGPEEKPRTLNYERKRRQSAKEILFGNPWVVAFLVGTLLGAGLWCGWAVMLVLVLVILLGVKIANIVMDRQGTEARTLPEETGVTADEEAEEQATLASAKAKFAQGPRGTWLAREMAFQSNLGGLGLQADTFGGMRTGEEVRVEFDEDGRGRFSMVQMEHAMPRSVETLFEYKTGDEGTIFVRLTSPDVEGWHKVRFGFEVRRKSDERLDLMMWLEGESPLPPDLHDFWPFDGREFILRQA